MDEKLIYYAKLLEAVCWRLYELFLDDLFHDRFKRGQYI